jgi:hypothetical protein
MLVGTERHQRRDCCGYEQRLPWCWTKEAAPWIEELGLLVFHIASKVLVIVLYWCWQCLLTFDGNLLPHIVTPLNVTTVAWCCRRNQDGLYSAECPPAALQTLERQWTASVFTTWYFTGSCSSLFPANKYCQQHLTAFYDCWTGVTDKCVRWYSASY